MKIHPLYFLTVAILIAIPTRISALDSLYLKAGYGGVWLFSKYIYSAEYPISTADSFGLGADLMLKSQHAISANFTGAGYFARSADFKIVDCSYKFLPFDWYNQIFIGAGLVYLYYDFVDAGDRSKFGGMLTYGFNFQFPQNIYLIAEFKNIFHPEMRWSSEYAIIQHSFSITGSIAYRFKFTEAK